MLRTRLGTAALVGTVLAAACWVLQPSTAEAKNKEHHKGHKARGKVVSVNVAANGSGSITIEKHKHHKKGAAAANAKPEVKTETFQVGPSTVFEAISKGAKQPASLAAVHRGEEVAIEGKKGAAEKVEIVSHSHREHKGKKGAVALN